MLENLLSMNGFVVANKKLSREIGLNASVLIGMLYSEYSFWAESGKLTDDNYFYCTRDKIEYNTGLSSYEQRSAIKKLVELNVLETKRDGMPAKTYYRIDESALLSILQGTKKVSDKSLKNSTTSGEETLQHDAKNPDINYNIYNKTKNNKIKQKQKSDSGSGTPKKSKTDKRLESISRKCLEYDLEENVIELLDRFFRNLIDNNKLVTDDKVHAILEKLAKVDNKTQMNAVQLSLDMGYMNIDPDWLRVNNKSKNKDSSIYWDGGTHETEEARQAYFDRLLNDPNTEVF